MLLFGFVMGEYRFSEFLLLAGVAVVLVVVLIGFCFQSWPRNEKLALTGIWIIVSFFIMVGVEGALRGIDRRNIVVPKKPAVVVFLIAFVLLGISAVTGAA